MTRSAVRLVVAPSIPILLTTPTRVSGWGSLGHAIVVRAALAGSDGLPEWLRDAILEEYGVPASAFGEVRDGRPGALAAAAGVLAHLAGDAAVPLHVARHHHSWVGPNPRGFTRLGGISFCPAMSSAACARYAAPA